MAQPGSRSRFACEASPDFRVGSVCLRQELEHDATVKTGVLGQVNVAHAAGADMLQDTIMSNYRLHSALNSRLGDVISIVVFRQFEHPRVMPPENRTRLISIL
jgi:hypothetical protein